MVGWYPLLRVLSVITAFMNGIYIHRTGGAFVAGIRGSERGLPRRCKSEREARGVGLDTRFSFFETLLRAWIRSFMKALKLLFTPSPSYRPI